MAYHTSMFSSIAVVGAEHILAPLVVWVTLLQLCLCQPLAGVVVVTSYPEMCAVPRRTTAVASSMTTCTSLSTTNCNKLRQAGPANSAI